MFSAAAVLCEVQFKSLRTYGPTIHIYNIIFIYINLLAFSSQTAAPEDAFLLADDHPAVTCELQRRTLMRQRAEAKESEKDKDTKIKQSRKRDAAAETSEVKSNERDNKEKENIKWQTNHQQLAELRTLV